MRVVVLTTAITATLLLAGCSASGGGQAVQGSKLTPTVRAPAPSTTPSPSATSSPRTTTTAAPAANAPIPAVTAWLDAAKPVDTGGFHTATRDGVATQLGTGLAFVTPSGKTQCMTDSANGGALACLVDLTHPPARPSDSYGKWIGGWVDFDGTSLQVGSSHADPGRFALGTGARLDYGTSLRFGDYQCRSDPAGLVCVNYAHQTGVRMADAGTEPLGCLQKVSDPTVGLKYTC
jgi:hypothetical protein